MIRCEGWEKFTPHENDDTDTLMQALIHNTKYNNWCG